MRSGAPVARVEQTRGRHRRNMRRTGSHLIGEKATDASAQNHQGAVVALGLNEVDEEIDLGVITHGCGNRRPRAPVQRQVDGTDVNAA